MPKKSAFQLPLINATVLQLSKDTNFPKQSRNRFYAEYQKLNSNIGKYVLRGDNVTTIHQDTIYANPKKVSILSNEFCASSTEQFLLAASQSSKVKLIGVPTMGSLDMSNMNVVKSQSNEFQLAYAALAVFS